MKKIMFNDRFGLTDAVLEGRKTVTRRIVTDEIYGESYIDDNPPRIDEIHRPTTNSKYIKSHLSKYQVGEVIAIAQKYQDIINYSHYNDKEIESISKSAGWSNKMFVLSYLMPNQIEILDVRVERLQDITDEDCIKEGVKIGKCVNDGNWMTAYYIPNDSQPYVSARDAFAVLIDKVGKKGTWESNPYVFRYEFKLK